MKYAPKEPQNQAEIERFFLTRPSGQPFGREIEIFNGLFFKAMIDFFDKKSSNQIGLAPVLKSG